jgi:hypothetical protein
MCIKKYIFYERKVWRGNSSKNSNLLFIFYKTILSHEFLEHNERNEECYKANKCDKMAYKTSVIQYFFYFAPILNFKLKKKFKHNARKVRQGHYKWS